MKLNLIIKKGLISIFIVCCVASFTACSGILNTFFGDTTEENSPSIVYGSEDVVLIDASAFDHSCYNQLTDTEKQIYDIILDAVANFKTKCDFKEISFYQDWNLERAFYGVYRDHPECFWFSDTYLLREGTSRKSSLEWYNYDFWDYTTDKEGYIARFNGKTDEIVEKASQYSTDYEKAKFVHDYFMKNAYYDFDALDNSKSAKPDASSYKIYTSYGCIVEGKTVCNGYAQAYQVIMNKLGIDCYYSHGMALEGAHAWNILELDGEHYLLDLTFDDIDPTDDSVIADVFCKYDYFLDNWDDFTIDHLVNREYFDVPECDAKKYNYFTYNGYVVDNYRLDTVKQMISKQLQNDTVASVKFASSEIMKASYSDFDENDGYIEIDGKMLMYIFNHQKNILNFYPTK